MAAFSLDNFSVALTAFLKANELKPSAQLKTWIRKCEAEIGSQEERVSHIEDRATLSSQTVQVFPPPVVSQSNQPPPDLPKVATTPRFKHDFFQTESVVTVTIFAKGVRKEAVTVNIQKRQLDVTIKLGEGKEFNLDWNLCGEVIPEQSKYEVLSTKIEIKLKKASPVLWKSLEGDGQVQKWAVVQDGESGLAYPTSSKKPVNWDKVTVEEEKLEGDRALHNVFQGIYKNADDDQRRAMMKSFQESGGTVLSTNWSEVGKGEVKVTPPKGLEAKKWSDLHH
eukprot:TRINITY_DN9377_c0_g2_i4.p1 TRINITY_DN9377_c0_g2~~TRINITY_DN9377_c0_g2_i4.p1  ORF type:complete len:281 (-),score=53.02 TRINITY_DN9377_c0_g2_i4:135-977(-)